MMGRLKTVFIYILVSAGLLSVSEVVAQVQKVDSLVSRGDSLRRLYRFEESVAAYTEALEFSADTSVVKNDSLIRLEISDRILLSENGKSMAGFTYSPTVVARHKFSLDDFFLYYPLKDRSWRPLPGQLDSLSGPYARAIYAPDDDDTIYYSASDEGGIRNIYTTTFRDTVWTLPALINEHLTSSSDEIYPMLSPDGKSLYFASKGLYGVGGYDIYVSQWDEEQRDWSIPVNMGFPYSSPANDFLMINTEDGFHTIFASDRDCEGDSVWVYVLEYDSMPVRKELSDPEQLLKLSRLEPLSDSERMSGGADVKTGLPENEDTRRYMDKMAEVRAFRDSISLYGELLDADREKYSLTGSESDRQKLAGQILSREAMIPVFQGKLEVAMKQLQDIEMDFLFSGLVIDPDELLQEAEREVVGETTSYAFTKMVMGEPLDLVMERPEPEFDYSFKILEEGQFAENDTIPEGIVYQIQIFSSGQKASVKSLRGLSPVFESRSVSGRYIYRVGLFNSYNDVLSHINAVKKAGFRSAFIVGYVDGKEMSVSKVRNLEKELKNAKPTLYRVIISPEGGAMDPIAMEGIIQQVGERDIARMEKDGATVFVVGPFDDKSKADALIRFVDAMGYGQASMEELSN